MEPKKEPSKTLIYVSNLPFNTTDEQFRDLFKDFKVKTAYVARRKNGRSKGFGFVNLENESDQNAAIERANNTDMENRKLIAKVAFNDDRRNEKGELREEFMTQNQGGQSTPSETIVHVSNLAWTVTNEELAKVFEAFNPKVATVAFRRNGRSKGFGFVEFNSKEDQEKALKLHGTTLSGRNIIVQASISRGQNQPRLNNNRPRNNNFNNNNRGNNNRGNNNRGNNNNRPRNNNNSNKNFQVVRRNERKSENTLYISNLPFELDDNDLRQIFQEFNPKNAHIPLRRNGKSRGYGFVEFNNANDRDESLKALDQSEVNGRVITIKVSQPTQRNDQNRPRNNQNFNNRRNNNQNFNNRRNNNNNNRQNNNQNRPRYNQNFDNRRNNNNNNNQNRPRYNQRRNDSNREVSTNMVYVSNLPFSVDDNGLAAIFKGFKVNKSYVSRKYNGNSRGYGFVEFASNEDQQNALKNNGMDVSGRPIVVQAAFKVENRNN